MKLLLIIINIVYLFTSLQTQDGKAIIDKMISKYNLVKDYEVNADIQIDVEYLKVPKSSVKIFFKQPDKFKFQSDNFALLPRESINFSPQLFLKENYTSFYIKDENYNGFSTYVIKIIPLNDKSEIVLTTLWIDKKNYFVRKVEIATKINGTNTIEMEYKNNPVYPLPTQIKFTFEILKSNIPGNFQNQNENENKSAIGNNNNKTSKGTVIINYKNYKVNIGLSDKIFNENKN